MANTTVGTISLLATIDTSKYKKGISEINSGNKSVGDSVDQATQKTSSFSKMSAAGFGLVAGAAASLANKGINLITSSISDAIKRVDTLKNADRTFANMGFSADQSKTSIAALNKSILGLPTSLDAGVRGVTLLASSTGDLGKSQKIFSALNDGILGFGGSADMVDNAILQLSQSFAGGRVDAQTWNSMLNSGLGPALNAIAKQMGITTKSLKAGLSDGSISVGQFQDSLINLDQNGGGGLKSLHTIAKDSTKGIGTGFDNMQTAITRGLAAIITSFGSTNISDAITKIGKAFEKTLTTISSFIKFLKDNQWALYAFGGALTGIGVALAVVVAPAVWGAVVAFGALLVAAAPFILIGAAIGLIAFVIVKNWKTVKDFFMGVWQWIKDNWPLLLTILLGPIGLAASLIIKNFDTIKSAIGEVIDWIKTAFSTIGSIAGGAIKGVVNGALGLVGKTINDFIGLINGVLHLINKIPGVNIGNIGKVNIPQMADGGIVSRPTLAMIGEGNGPEAVIPLSKLDSIMGKGGKGTTINQYNTVNSNVDMNIVNRRLTREFRLA